MVCNLYQNVLPQHSRDGLTIHNTWELGGGCTVRQFARMGKDERNMHRKKWKDKVKFDDRWLVDMVISAFKRLLGEAVRAVKPEYVLRHMATKIAVYNRTWDIMIEAVGR